MPNGISPLRHLAVFTVTFAFSLSTSADVFNMPAGQTSLQFVSVGNVDNPNDRATGYGGVGYNYAIGKCETTVGQYVQFLNAVAKTDTYGLYNTSMASDLNIAGIARGGLPGSYMYSAIGSPNRPIAYVSWGSTVRFANWLTNGQPTGQQGAGTTETGSYTLNGATTAVALNAVSRTSNARYVLPTENEWYKAYYDPTKAGSHYWLYAMRTDAVPHSALPPGSGAPNAAYTANFYQDDGIANTYDSGYVTTGSRFYSGTQNYLTDVGAYTAASSYYGTFDQSGGLWEWNEAIYSGFPFPARFIRGGSWGNQETPMRASYRSNASDPTTVDDLIGFRIALVPEPATLGLLTLGAVFLIRRPRASRFQSEAALV